MTPELEKRWRDGSPPFHGPMAISANGLTLSTLRELLLFCADQLEPLYPEVWRFRDWHEHDGVVLNATKCDWIDYRMGLDSERNLFNSRDDDDLVRIALFPSNYDWLLRYNIDADFRDGIFMPSEDGSDFDFSCTSAAPVAVLVKELVRTWPADVGTKEVSKEYFDSSYGGP